MNMHNYVFGFFLLVTFPAAGFAAQDAGPPGSSEQRAACDARCREDYQNNASALQACLRDCGAVGPASPGGAIAPAHEAAHTAQQAGAGAEPATAATINTSKSNTYRSTGSPGTGAQPAEAIKLNSSKTNTREVEDGSSGAVEDTDGDH